MSAPPLSRHWSSRCIVHFEGKIYREEHTIGHHSKGIAPEIPAATGSPLFGLLLAEEPWERLASDSWNIGIGFAIIPGDLALRRRLDLPLRDNGGPADSIPISAGRVGGDVGFSSERNLWRILPGGQQQRHQSFREPSRILPLMEEEEEGEVV